MLAVADEHPFEAFYRATHRRLYAYAFRMVHDGELAADLVQDALERSLPRLLGQAEAPPVEQPMWSNYLFRTVHNLALNALQRRRELATDPAMLPVGARTDIAEQLATNDAVQRCLQLLSEEERSGYLLAVDGFKQHEIAEVLGIGPDAAFRRIRTAEKRLRICLEGTPRDG